MIITKQKQLAEIIKSLLPYQKIFLIGCGECSTTCKTGGEPELAAMKQELEKNGKTVMGMAIPSAPCVSSKTKTELAKNMKVLRESEAILVMACGLGVQSVKENDRLELVVMPGCDTLCGAVMDAKGNFYEKCSMCRDCILSVTGGICPVTLCPKGLLNGPCGGMNKGKCEVDKEKDCAWVLIYKELEKRKQTEALKTVQQPKDFQKMNKPRKLIMTE